MQQETQNAESLKNVTFGWDILKLIKKYFTVSLVFYYTHNY